MTQQEQHDFMGYHVLGEMYGIPAEKLDNMELLKEALTKGIEASGATICSMQEKQFDPQGITLLALLSESHASIHTYPDRGALFFDAFTCGETCQPIRIAEALSAYLEPERSDLQTIRRPSLKTQ